MRLIFAVIFVFWCSVCGAATLEWAGSVGNSGGNGEAWSMVHSTVGRSGGGVVVDHAGRIYTGGGDRILVLNQDGKLLWSSDVPRQNWVLGGPTFAISGNYLYFIAGQPQQRGGFMNLLSIPWAQVEPNVCRVEMSPGAKAQIVVPAPKTGWTSVWVNGEVTLASDPTDGAVYIGYGTPNSTYGVFHVRDGIAAPQFTSPVACCRFSIDETGRWYLGSASQVRQIDKTGKDLSGTQPLVMPKLASSIASTWLGTVMLTKDQIWDMGILGFVGRFSRQMVPDPGAVTQFNQALYYTAQIADAPDGAYYIKSDSALYLARIVKSQLALSRRFGSISHATALCVLPNGYIGVGNDATNFFWYDFADQDPATAPVKAEYTGPTAQGYVDGNTLLTYQIGDYSTPLGYSPGSTALSLTTYEPDAQAGSVAVSASRGTYPVAQIAAVTRAGNWVFALDTKLNTLLRGTTAAPCVLTQVAMQPAAQSAKITSIAGLGSNTLLVATDTGIDICGIDASGSLSVRSTYQLPAEYGPFGKQIFLASDSNRIVAADSDRHRVLVLRSDDTQSVLTPVTQFGETDTAGTDDEHLDTPTLVGISTGRIVIYDSGNQRVVKLRLRE